MGQKKYLLDTNVIIDYLTDKLPPDNLKSLYEPKDFICHTSIICKIEIMGHHSAYESKTLNDFIEKSFIIELDKKVVDKTIEVRRKNKIKIADAIIAGTALAYNFILVTNNTKDFKKLEKLELINPYDL